MSRSICRLAVFLLLCSTKLWAEDPEHLLITATKISLSEKEVGSAFTVLTEKDFQNGQASNLVDALRGVPGLDTVQSGGPGQLASVFLRGAKDGNVLVLVDGVEINNPISPSRGYDFSGLELDNIERVEILRGPQSPLYGSDAAGGVIQIFTKKGTGETKVSASLQGGSYSTFKGLAGVTGGTETSAYSFTASRVTSDGFSAADEKLGNTEDDGMENSTFSGRLSLFEKSPIQLESSFHFHEIESDVDNGGGAFQDDPNHVSSEKQTFVALGARGKLWEDALEESLRLTWSDQDRKDENPADPANPSSEDADYRGKTWKVDWQNTWYANERHTWILGVDTEEDRGQSRYLSNSPLFGIFLDEFSLETSRSTGVYGQDQITLNEQWFATTGLRVDHHDRFGTEATYRIASSYLPQKDLQIKGSLGTGFKAPTLYQLFSSYGDSGLEPEKSVGMDLGFEVQLTESAALGMSGFHNHFKNLIDFDFGSFRYNNVSTANTQGLECSASWAVSEKLTLEGSYTYTDTEDENTNESLLRRPEHKGSLDAVLQLWDDKASLRAQLDYVGESDDLDFSVFPSEKVTLDGYALVHVSGAAQVTETLQIFGRLQNAFDKDYEQVIGFATEARSFYAGAKIVWG